MEKLIQYIKQHGRKAWINGNKIHAVEVYSGGREEVVLEANYSAVRAWLGY